jgi:hypothetical protein
LPLEFEQRSHKTCDLKFNGPPIYDGYGKMEHRVVCMTSLLHDPRSQSSGPVSNLLLNISDDDHDKDKDINVLGDLLHEVQATNCISFATDTHFEGKGYRFCTSKQEDYQVKSYCN